MTENVETVVAVPGDADYASSISFEYEHREGSIRQISVASASDRYPFYPSLESARCSDEVIITVGWAPGRLKIRVSVVRFRPWPPAAE
jgi:hypothetical protein